MMRAKSCCTHAHLYRARNLVERFFNKSKQCRRVGTRYDKLAANYLAFVQLASIRLWLRVNEYTLWYQDLLRGKHSRRMDGQSRPAWPARRAISASTAITRSRPWPDRARRVEQ